jgi:S-DNA-T family DNA segregation ATPase FtsK/SpoIIIE
MSSRGTTSRSSGSSRRGSSKRASSESSERSSASKKAAKAPRAEKSDVDEDEGITAGLVARPELIGVLLILVGVFVGLAVYLSLAGPLGRAVSTALGWVAGLGRFGVPVVLVLAGLAILKRPSGSAPARSAIGWGLLTIAALGALHLLRGPSGFGPMGDYDSAGGAVGALVAEPLRQLIAWIGASLVLFAVALAGLVLATRTPPMVLMRRASSSIAHAMRPMGRLTRKAIDDLSTLSSDRDGAVQQVEAPAGEVALDATVRPYDFRQDGDEFEQAGAAPRKPAQRRRTKAKAPQATAGAAAGDGTWTLPAVELLSRSGAQNVDRSKVEERGRVLQESLAQHGVDTTLVGMTVGPTVTRYELELAPGVKVARITSLQRDIAYAMAATDVRILAPIPGRSAIGVEVPNADRQLVSLGDLMNSAEAVEATRPLDVAIGKDIAGRAVFLDLASTPHLLIAGATGAGKSSGLNCIITSLLMRATPDQVRLILVDPKQVEMGQYQRLPHLLTQPVTDPRKAANALGWAVKEMERRYGLLSTAGVRDITSYNQAWDSGDLDGIPGLLPPVDTTVDTAVDDTSSDGGESDDVGTADKGPERLAFIVVVVDELNDLMMVAARDVEESITRIAQKARAVGIHLIIATQRPSVNVITGVIKANVPARMAFAVSSLTDSRVILDQPGAEKLVGRGDMLMMLPTSSEIHRIQGSFVSEAEVRAVVGHWHAQAHESISSTGPEPIQITGGEDAVTSSSNAVLSVDDGDEDTVMMRQAMELVVRSQLGSTSMLQRKLKVGFARAGRIMDLLEQRGVVGPSEGSKAREVLMTVEEFELLQQSGQV